MYYTYVLKSQKDGKFYIGYSADLKKRFKEHTDGEVKSTKHRRPLDLIFYEAFKDRRDAQRREKYFKTEKGKSSLNQMVRFSKI
ncbi:MAG: GIY-YIG nuclease family protein [Candidatus Staskawiczbacteria bacterium]|nr:GIY-YIG nuclease family protein [Candidatus Staskawiczbacteria bacterium]